MHWANVECGVSFRVTNTQLSVFDAISKQQFGRDLYAECREAFPEFPKDRFDALFEKCWRGYPALNLEYETSIRDLFTIALASDDFSVPGPEFMASIQDSEACGFPREEVIASLAAKIRRDREA